MRQQRFVAAPGRLGFTLVEMLVVLAILVVLASLSAAGIMRWLANQPIEGVRVLTTNYSDPRDAAPRPEIEFES